MNLEHKRSITALILSGGQSRRMGGKDKGLLTVRQHPLIEHVLDVIQPQVGSLMISANRNQEKYARYGYPVLTDSLDDFQGPLAGMFAGLQATTTPLLLVLPCDGPLLSKGLVTRLFDALTQSNADIAVAHDGERLQPVHVLLRCSLQQSLHDYLESGQRKIDRWYEQHHWCSVDFSDNPEQFLNVNTPEDREHLAKVGT